MAIVLTTADPSFKLLMAFNNNVIRFNSDSVLVPAKAEIIGLGFDVVLYPHPDGSFYFNFKDYISAIINTDNFKDDLNVALPTYNYDWTSKIFLQNAITLKIYFTNSTFETKVLNLFWISAYLQVDEFSKTYPVVNFDDLFVLTPRTKNVLPRMKYWQGYPFDITFSALNAGFVDIENSGNPDTTNNIADPFTINRFVVSDGTNENYSLLLISGENSLNFSEETNDDTIILEKIIPDCSGKHYIKWINRFGGWNYWLFDRGRKILTPKGLGEINNDFNNLEDTLSPTLNIGVSSKKSIFVNDDVHEKDMLLLSDLFESPKIYLFTGEPNTVSNFNSWLEVGIKDKSTKIQDAKYNYINVEVEIELPTRTTRKL